MVKPRVGPIATLALITLLASGLANAALIPVLISGPTPVPSTSDFTYDYRVDLLPDESLNPTATMGVTCPGPGSTLVQCNPAGPFVTIYDVPDFVSASVSSPGWSATVQTTGVTPSTINGGTFDDPTLVNVTFSYTGPEVDANGTKISFTGFDIVSTAGGTSPGNFSYQATKNTGSEAGDTDQGDGPVTVPGSGSGIQATTPEPASMALWGSGLVLLGLGRRLFLRR
jgi:hypothetical protein